MAREMLSAVRPSMIQGAQISAPQADMLAMDVLEALGSDAGGFSLEFGEELFQKFKIDISWTILSGIGITVQELSIGEVWYLERLEDRCKNWKRAESTEKSLAI